MKQDVSVCSGNFPSLDRMLESFIYIFFFDIASIDF